MEATRKVGKNGTKNMSWRDEAVEIKISMDITMMLVRGIHTSLSM